MLKQTGVIQYGEVILFIMMMSSRELVVSGGCRRAMLALINCAGGGEGGVGRMREGGRGRWEVGRRLGEDGGGGDTPARCQHIHYPQPVGGGWYFHA